MKLRYLNLSLFFQQLQFLLPVMLLFYFKNNLSIGDYLFFQSIAYVLYMIFGIPTGYIADHISKKYALIIGCSLNIVRLFLYLVCEGYSIIFIGEILMTFIRFLTTGIADSYIFEYLKEQKQERKMLHLSGKALMFMCFGVAIGSLLGPFIYKFLGFKILLYIELFCATISMLFLFKLPKTRIYHSQKYSIKDIQEASLALWKNKAVRWLIFYNMFLYAATTIFVSTFQPLMKLSFVPITLFGSIYFSNHLIRGIFSKFTNQFVLYLRLQNLVKIGLFCVIVGFLLMLLAFNIKNSYLTLTVLFYTCLVIGLQLVNQITNINRIHRLILPDLRVTGISIYNMICHGFGGIMLSLFQKISLDFNAADKAYFTFAILFLCILIFSLSKIKILRR